MSSGVKMVGDIKTWQEFGDLIVKEMVNCDNQGRFNQLLISLSLSIGNLPQMKQLRKKLGLKPYTKKELKGFKALQEGK